MIHLNYVIDHILYEIFKIILNTSSKRHQGVNDNPSIRIYANKIENKITFRIKTGYYLNTLTPETMKLLGTTKSKITKEKMVKMIYKFRISPLKNLVYIYS